MEEVQISGVAFGDRTYIEKNTLYINKEELTGLLAKDANFQAVRISVARPGDKTRIVNVADVIEARCKVSEGVDFPGYLNEVVSVGRGVTRALKGMTVVCCDRHPHWIHSKSLIDMADEGAALGRYGQMVNVVVDPEPADGVEDFDYARSVKLAGLKTAVYLAKAAEKKDVTGVETFDMTPCDRSEGNLPRVAYYFQAYSPQHDAQGVADPIFYSTPITKTMPFIAHPNEILDGALLSGYSIRMMETYSIQNHPIIKELYRRHGKELDFVGVVVAASSMEAENRPLNASRVGVILKDILGADGVIMTKPMGGAPNVDLGEAAAECERLGVKTSIIIQMLTTETFINSEAMFNTPSLNAIVNNGSIFYRVKLAAVNEVLGGTAETPIFDDRKRNQCAAEALELEQRFVCGSLNQIGASRALAAQY
ncbi:MAG: glycine/sarcosine/betaine reductase component B subunit [Syntrophales bacterium]|nr:glycine/sarcosine/betaine reductase component B subunit [Syntrophales bacterium]